MTGTVPTDVCFEMINPGGMESSIARLLRALLDGIRAHLRTAPQPNDCPAVVVRSLWPESFGDVFPGQTPGEEIKPG